MTVDFALDVHSNVVIERVKDGLEAAFHEREISVPNGESSGFQEANIKVQKLVHRVVEHFEIPIIRTWYRYGQFEPYGTLRPKRVTPSRLNEPQKRVPSAKFDDLTKRDIKGYFIELDDLKDEWEEPLFTFLRRNYEDAAEDDFREIYLANHGVLRVLEEIKSTNELEQNADKYADELQPSAIDLWYELQNAEYFNEREVELVRTFLDDLQMALVSLAAEDNVEGRQITTLKRSWEIYHHKIWPWPAMQISLSEAKGPENELQQEFLPEGRRYLDMFQNTFPESFDSWQTQLREVNLVSSPSRYQSVKGEIPEPLGQLDRGVLISGFDGE